MTSSQGLSLDFLRPGLLYTGPSRTEETSVHQLFRETQLLEFARGKQGKVPAKSRLLYHCAFPHEHFPTLASSRVAGMHGPAAYQPTWLVPMASRSLWLRHQVHIRHGRRLDMPLCLGRQSTSGDHEVEGSRRRGPCATGGGGLAVLGELLHGKREARARVFWGWAWSSVPRYGVVVVLFRGPGLGRRRVSLDGDGA